MWLRRNPGNPSGSEMLLFSFPCLTVSLRTSLLLLLCLPQSPLTGNSPVFSENGHLRFGVHAWLSKILALLPSTRQDQRSEEVGKGSYCDHRDYKISKVQTRAKNLGLWGMGFWVLFWSNTKRRQVKIQRCLKGPEWRPGRGSSDGKEGNGRLLQARAIVFSRTAVIAPFHLFFWQCILTVSPIRGIHVPSSRIWAWAVTALTPEWSGIGTMWLPRLCYTEDIASTWLSLLGCSHVEPSPHIVRKPRSQGENARRHSGGQLQPPASTTICVSEGALRGLWPCSPQATPAEAKWGKACLSTTQVTGPRVK